MIHKIIKSIFYRIKYLSRKVLPMILMAVFLIQPGLSQSNEEVFSLDLEGCIDFALENSWNLENSRIDVKIANKQVKETVGRGLPQIDGEVSYMNNFAVQTVFLPAVFFADDPSSIPDNAPPVPVRFGVQNTGTAGISLSQLLFDGSYLVGLQAANTYQELSRRSLEASEVEVVAAVTKAYYGVLIAKERLDLIDANFKRLDTLLYETNIMLENGFAEQLDVDRIRLNYNNILTERENTQRILALNYALLKYQMGMGVNQTLLLEGSLDDYDFEPYNVQTLEDSMRFAQRKDYSVLQTSRDLSLLDLKNYRVANLPKLNGFVGFGYNSGTDTFDDLMNTNNWFNYGNFGVSLSIPIFSGMQRYNRIQQAKLAVEKSENDLNAMQNTILLEIEQAKTAYNNALNRLETTEENMALAQRIYDVTKEKNQAGLGSNFEVVEADTDIKEAETNYYSAFYDVLVSKVDLEKALGILSK
ncbi:MAG: TolC family protein [Candidatus Cyclobacteriaceae bacterium M3_2C_046]